MRDDFWRDMAVAAGALVVGTALVALRPDSGSGDRAGGAPAGEPPKAERPARPEAAPKPRSKLKSPAPKRRKTMNHLAGQKSPYLLQHADNPVDWYPWGEDAFSKARSEQKPIFLSIGYATCHWCHVMEEESFVNEEIARILNAHFVSIKVDREERPDVDKVYMTAAAGAGWGGGWPLSVWLTPDLKPFFGGTYFPPDARYGRPGFRQILERVAGVWKERKEDVLADGEKIAVALSSITRVSGREAPIDAGWLGGMFAAYSEAYRSYRGGFGDAPKFPMPVNQDALLRYYARTGEKKALEMVEGTLSEMAGGGIYDHVGGGFHRYSTDDEWRIPHFEKMLYDNAQLAVNYLEAYQAGKNPEFARIAGETLDYVLRDMTHPKGGFYSAEDADSLPPELAAQGESEGGGGKSEGAFYLWTRDELDAVLGSGRAEMFSHRFGVRAEGNAHHDPHGEFQGKNILYAENSIEETAGKFAMNPAEARRRLKEDKRRLLEIRSKRPRPVLDDKVLASWNGLMISAFAKGYQVLEDPRYLAAAENAARFVKANLWDPGENRLFHRWREGERAVEGLASDYAFLLAGLLDLYEASFDPDWLDWAVQLAETLQKDFFDPEGGFYMTASDRAGELLVRVIVDTDNVEPADSSSAALSFLRLAQFTGRDDLRKAAEKTLNRFGAQMRDAPRSLPAMLGAVDFATAKPRQIIVAGELEAPATREILRMVNQRYIPGKILMVVPPGEAKARLAARLPILKGMVPIKGKPTAYICVNYACELPTGDLAEIEKILAGS